MRWMSLWHSPQWVTAMSTSNGPRSPGSWVKGSSGPRFSRTAKAFTISTGPRHRHPRRLEALHDVVGDQIGDAPLSPERGERVIRPGEIHPAEVPRAGELAHGLREVGVDVVDPRIVVRHHQQDVRAPSRERAEPPRHRRVLGPPD